MNKAQEMIALFPISLSDLRLSRGDHRVMGVVYFCIGSEERGPIGGMDLSALIEEGLKHR